MLIASQDKVAVRDLAAVTVCGHSIFDMLLYIWDSKHACTCAT